MPITRKFAKLRQRNLEKLTPAQHRQLLHGDCWIYPAKHGFADADELRLAWKIHRAEILPLFIKQHPANRPFAFWFCDVGCERPVINHGSDDEAWLKAARDETFGYAHTSIGIPRDGKLIPFQQPQWRYLKEHNLLTAAEKAMTDDELDNAAL